MPGTAQDAITAESTNTAGEDSQLSSLGFCWVRVGETEIFRVRPLCSYASLKLTLPRLLCRWSRSW